MEGSLTERVDSRGERKRTELLVGVVRAGTRLIAVPEAEVLDPQGVLLVDLQQRHDHTVRQEARLTRGVPATQTEESDAADQTATQLTRPQLSQLPSQTRRLDGGETGILVVAMAACMAEVHRTDPQHGSTAKCPPRGSTAWNQGT